MKSKNNQPWLRDGGYYDYSYLLSFNKKIKNHEGKEVYLYPIRYAIGGRGTGKTTDLQDKAFSRKYGFEGYFGWLRLTQPPIDKIMKDPYEFIDKVIKKRYNISRDDIDTDQGFMTYQGKRKGYFASLSTYHHEKSTMDFSNLELLIIDEIKREKSERNTFDIQNALINQIETMIRNRNTIVLMGSNTIGDSSELLDFFGFEPREFGIYKLPRKGVIIHYFEDSAKFKAERPYRTSSRLAASNESAKSSLENLFLSEKVTLTRPLNAFINNFIIRFDTHLYIIYGTWLGKIAFREVSANILDASLDRDQIVMHPKIKAKIALPVYAWHISLIGHKIMYDPQVIKDIKESVGSANLAFSNKTIFNILRRYLTSYK